MAAAPQHRRGRRGLARGATARQAAVVAAAVVAVTMTSSLVLATMFGSDASEPSATGSPRGSVPQATNPSRTPAAQGTATPSTPSSPTAGNPTPVRTAAKPGRPNQLYLPTLDVVAPVTSIRAVGGSLTPPSNPRTVGWWADGAQPGAKRGSAVITGHTVHDGGGAFDDLGTLRRGDPVLVTTNRGVLRYAVTSIAVYRKKSFARVAAQVLSQSVPGRLVLVTCEDWTGTEYLSNAVVIAIPS